MTISWTVIAFAVWDTIFNKGRFWAFTSKKEEDAKELVSRAEFIVKHIPPEMIDPGLIPKIKNGKMQTSPPVLDFEEIHSKIQGFPQGGNQLRQRGCSGIFEDECAFQEESEDTYVAAEPTIKGGGWMIKVSSRSVEDKGFFKRIVFDKLNAETTRFPEIPPVPAKLPMEGIEVWTNPQNQFTVCDIHYTANPDKRGDDFRESLRSSLPIKKFRMEYGKSWETYDGRPVYEDFNEVIHVTHTKPRIEPNLPLLLGWDSSGLTPACVIAQLQEDRLIVVREIMGTDIALSVGARRFVPYVAEQIRLEFQQITDIEKQTISFFDPAGLKRNEITEETYIAELIRHGFKQVRPGPVSFKKRIDGVTEFLVGLSRGKPKFELYEQGCPVLTTGFKGGYRYADGIDQREPEKAQAIKDIHSHPQDGLQYICGGLKSLVAANYNIDIPKPQYGFQKHTDITPKPRKSYG